MSRINIVDLEVFYQIGVTDEERAKPQRLLITVEMDLDFTTAAMSDRLEKTINYFDITQELLKYGTGRNWKLLEKLTTNIADFIMAKFRPEAVVVEIKKFSIPQAAYVSVAVARTRQ
ncbi:MAG TPA: dihydroneopterin aldolase [Candidatus Polarisedimenticolia bacterium]|nr:dihydroneopterin aldolase [Candidatus Polarisedimenticolia bacterium]